MDINPWIIGEFKINPWAVNTWKITKIGVSPWEIHFKLTEVINEQRNNTVVNTKDEAIKCALEIEKIFEESEK